ncbi:MAG: hypothetical protein IJR51_06985 [Clostridia bacterium]|nr:hypothetical protein [Clostridia bacterium]
MTLQVYRKNRRNASAFGKENNTANGEQAEPAFNPTGFQDFPERTPEWRYLMDLPPDQ